VLLQQDGEGGGDLEWLAIASEANNGTLSETEEENTRERASLM
jgi:hypothetical protein